MTNRGLAILAVITFLVLIIAGIAIGSRSTPGASEPTDYPMLFDSIQTQLKGVNRIAISLPDGAIEFVKDKSVWTLADADRLGYPVKPEKIAEIVSLFDRMEVVAKKTSNPSFHGQLGLNDAALEKNESKTESDAAKKVSLSDASGKTFAELLFGNSIQASVGQHTYVRKPNENQVWEINVALPNVSHEVSNWIDPELLDIDERRILSVSVSGRGEDPIEIYREFPDATLMMADLPDGYSVKQQSDISSLASVISNLRFEDVKLKAFAPRIPALSSTVVFSTFDGVVVQMTTTSADGKYYATFSASYNESLRLADTSVVTDPKLLLSADDAKAQAASLNEKLNKWSYVLPEWKIKRALLRRSDLIEPYRRGRQILIAYAGAKDSDKETVTRSQDEAKTKAQEIRDSLLQTPENFEQLARDESDDVRSKSRGGFLGDVRVESNIKYFDDERVVDLLFDTIAVDQISDVIETDYGYHIVQRIK